MFPWLDRRGRFSPLKALTFAALFVPAAWAVLGYLQGDLGARPLTELIHQTGLWAVRLIFLSLAITPLRQVLQWPELIAVRRMIGVAAFAYAAAHLTLYAADEMFDLQRVASEIVLRLYLTIGFVTLLGLAALAATSTDGMIRRLSGRIWRRLHQTLYGLAAVALLHYFLQSKLNVGEPLVMLGIYLWLMGWRAIGAWRGRNRRVPVAMLAGAAVACGALTALAEAGWFWAATGVDPARVIQADFSLVSGLRPGWLVLAICLTLALVGAAIPAAANWRRRRASLAVRPA